MEEEEAKGYRERIGTFHFTAGVPRGPGPERGERKMVFRVVEEEEKGENEDRGENGQSVQEIKRSDGKTWKVGYLMAIR